MKRIGFTVFSLLATLVLAVWLRITPSDIVLCWFVFSGVVSILCVLANLVGNYEREGSIGKLYGRFKLSSIPYYVVSRDKRKRTQWLELGHVESLDGKHRVYTITLFYLTAQIGWLGEREVKENEQTEHTFTYKKEGRTAYSGPDIPEEMRAAMREMEAARNSLYRTKTGKDDE